jgi:hypothetical protein
VPINARREVIDDGAIILDVELDAGIYMLEHDADMRERRYFRVSPEGERHDLSRGNALAEARKSMVAPECWDHLSENGHDTPSSQWPPAR